VGPHNIIVFCKRKTNLQKQAILVKYSSLKPSRRQTDHNINALCVLQSTRLSFHHKTNVPTTTRLIDHRLYVYYSQSSKL